MSNDTWSIHDADDWFATSSRLGLESEAKQELKEVFDHHFKHVKFDAVLARKFHQMINGFMNKNPEHIEFFGGVLTGVHRVRFTSMEFNRITDEILRLDLVGLKRDFDRAEGIVPQRKIAGDLFNFIMAYLCHRFWTSPLLAVKLRKQAAETMILISSIRSLVSLMVRDFNYLVNPDLAAQVYERMSNRFILKQLGSWRAYLEYRCTKVSESEYPHASTMVAFDHTQKITNWVVDTHNRVKETLKEIYNIIVITHQENDKLKRGSLTGTDFEGREVIVDKVGGYESKLDYLLQNYHESNTFIRQELLKLVVKVNQTTREQHLAALLTWFSENAFKEEGIQIQELIKGAVILAYNYLDANQMLDKRNLDYGILLTKLRNMYTTSRGENQVLIQLREQGEYFVRKAMPTLSEQQVVSLRTSFFLYCWIRAQTKEAFT